MDEKDIEGGSVALATHDGLMLKKPHGHSYAEEHGFPEGTGMEVLSAAAAAIIIIIIITYLIRRTSLYCCYCS